MAIILCDIVYKNGLKFTCTQCSKCCRFDPGFVFLTYSDLDRILLYLHLSKNEFIEKYCRTVNIGEQKRLSLIEKPDFDCIFWNKGGCDIYNSRPLQCRTYPFWKPFLTDRDAWDREAESCAGMNNGSVVDKEAIENCLVLRKTENYILL
ncbi:MAG: YkgJ family cysteine cluster protein [Spirochaetales bacterium]|nr:YkgJ family cysteine cluster protein [Spirochaetales bacterium]